MSKDWILLHLPNLIFIPLLSYMIYDELPSINYFAILALIMNIVLLFT